MEKTNFVRDANTIGNKYIHHILYDEDITVYEYIPDMQIAPDDTGPRM